MPKLLIVDDEYGIRSTLSAALKRRGYNVDTARDVKSAMALLTDSYDVILLDVMLPDGTGLDILETVMAREQRIPTIMISGNADIETAVKSIHMGASDFLEKPLTLDRVLVTLKNVLDTENLREENRALSERIYGRMIGSSPEIKRIIKEIKTTAPRSRRFMILGENGTGKELAARMIHDHSGRPRSRFVPVNCAALPSELIESELFGHIKGSFTGASSDKTGRFAEADGGTVFLDEIGDMPEAAQAKILRVIENGEVRPVGSDKITTVDVTIIAATNQPILKLVDDGRFRQDLFYRLNVVTISLPPLRDRRSDIPVLFEYFLGQFADQAGRKPVRLSDDAVELLGGYSFPGNVRELKNLAERVSIYIDKDTAEVADIKSLLPSVLHRDLEPLKDAVVSFETEYIENAIALCGGNISEAARRLGIERSLLYKKLKRHDPE